LGSLLTASLLQPLVGAYTDKHPQSYALPVGMGFSLIGLIVLAVAPTFGVVLIAAACVGIGSAIFHPESSRIARLASGGRHGLAQSLFQVGGNAGSAAGPLLAAWIVVEHGQQSIAWFSPAVVLAIGLLWNVGTWYKLHRLANKGKPAVHAARPQLLSRRQVTGAIAILLALIFSKSFYVAGLSSYYTFYLIDKFQLSVQSAQTYLFLFLFAAAAGTLLGGPLGDRFGRRYVIWGSILGVLPFTVALPYANLFWTGALTIVIGLIISSAFSAIVVYAQELVPGKVGMVSGLFFGFAFGAGGIGAAVLGQVADVSGVDYVLRICAFVPLIGLLTAFLPRAEAQQRARP
jgi:FSR family fosmidomycin resistance protein-like MFS transporter